MPIICNTFHWDWIIQQENYYKMLVTVSDYTENNSQIRREENM